MPTKPCVSLDVTTASTTPPGRENDLLRTFPVDVEPAKLRFPVYHSARISRRQSVNLLTSLTRLIVNLNKQWRLIPQRHPSRYMNKQNKNLNHSKRNGHPKSRTALTAPRCELVVTGGWAACPPFNIAEPAGRRVSYLMGGEAVVWRVYKLVRRDIGSDANVPEVPGVELVDGSTDVEALGVSCVDGDDD